MHEDRIEEERKVSEALRQELMRLRAAKSEPPAERTEKDGKLQELLAAALSMVEGLQSQLAERIEACADTAEAVKQERALRDAAEEACASMSVRILGFSTCTCQCYVYKSGRNQCPLQCLLMW